MLGCVVMVGATLATLPAPVAVSAPSIAKPLPVTGAVPVPAAVSAPSSLAVELAQEAGLTVLGFVRGDSMVAYTRPDRVTG